MTNPLLQALTQIEGSSNAAHRARVSLAEALATSLLRGQGLEKEKTGEESHNALEASLLALFSLSQDGLSLFPRHGDIEQVKRILDQKKDEAGNFSDETIQLMITQLNLYHDQVLANYQRSKKDAEEAKASPPKPDQPETPDIWFARPGEIRSEARAKDYSGMTVEDLLRELNQIEGSSIEDNRARSAIGDALWKIAPRIPIAIGRSNPAPSFRTFAGARLMVTDLFG